MQGLSRTQKRVLMMPACSPGLIRLVTFTLVSGLVVVLLDQGLSIPKVLTLLGAIALYTLAMTGSPVGVARACAPVARLVLAHAAVAS